MVQFIIFWLICQLFSFERADYLSTYSFYTFVYKFFQEFKLGV